MSDLTLTSEANFPADFVGPEIFHAEDFEDRPVVLNLLFHSLFHRLSRRSSDLRENVRLRFVAHAVILATIPEFLCSHVLAVEFLCSGGFLCNAGDGNQIGQSELTPVSFVEASRAPL